MQRDPINSFASKAEADTVTNFANMLGFNVAEFIPLIYMKTPTLMETEPGEIYYHNVIDKAKLFVKAYMEAIKLRQDSKKTRA